MARNLDNWTGLSENVVDGVDGDPHHGGEADEEADDLSPLGVVIVRPVFDRLVWDAVESKDGLERKQFIPYIENNNRITFVFNLKITLHNLKLNWKPIDTLLALYCIWN